MATMRRGNDSNGTQLSSNPDWPPTSRAHASGGLPPSLPLLLLFLLVAIRRLNPLCSWCCLSTAKATGSGVMHAARRNEFICWVDDAKQPTTRQRRIERTCAELLKGKKRPCCWAGCIHRTDKAPSRWQKADLIDQKGNKNS